jgi:hypothetical protein
MGKKRNKNKKKPRLGQFQSRSAQMAANQPMAARARLHSLSRGSHCADHSRRALT